MDIADWIARRRMRGQRLWGRGLQAPEDVVGYLTAMQAQEEPYARWSVAQRVGGRISAATLSRAFDDGRFLRTHVLRPTWHYVASTDLRWLMALSGPEVNRRNARRYEQLGLDPRTRSRASDVIAAAVSGGHQTRRELAAALERSGISTAGQRIAHLLMHAELSTVICSGAMRGKEHTYASFDERVPSIPGPAGEDALGELAWRYFSTRGPATLKDFVWWSGLKAADARTGLELIREKLDSRVVDDRVYWYVEKRPQSRGARIDLVQCYDEVIISYAESRDILQTGTSSFPLPRHIDGFTHVVLLGGRLLGHWRAASGRAGLTVETRLAERLGEAECDAMRSAIDRFLSFRRVGPVEWETR